MHTLFLQIDLYYALTIPYSNENVCSTITMLYPAGPHTPLFSPPPNQRQVKLLHEILQKGTHNPYAVQKSPQNILSGINIQRY